MYIYPRPVRGEKGTLVWHVSLVVTMCRAGQSGPLRKSEKRRTNLEKLCTAAYWIGIMCTVVAIITRALAVVGVFVFTATPGKVPISYRTFLDGAMLFFVMAIASSVTMWVKAKKL